MVMENKGGLGQGPLPRPLLWLPAGFGSSWAITLRPGFLTGCWPEASPAPCHVGLCTEHLTTDGEQARGQERVPTTECAKTEDTVVRNLIPEEISHHCAGFCSLEEVTRALAP